MKIKIAAILIIAILISSCASKAPVAVATPSPPPPVEVVKVTSNDGAAQGKTLYDNNCAKCHKLFAPTEFSREEWEPILVRMQKKARLEDADMNLIRSYIHAEQK